MEPFSVLIVEDYPLFREAVKLLLKQQNPNAKFYEAGTGGEALQIIKLHVVNLIILDIALPDINGIEVAAMILKENPSARILVLTHHQGVAMVKQLLVLGVKGIIFKDGGTAHIREAINCVSSGGQYLPPDLPPSFMARVTTTKASVILTRREAEMLVLLKQGLSSKQIADKLGLTEKTVNTYREDLLDKTQTQNVAELIAYGYDNGLIG